ncbi:MAG: SDR family oxidoreductase [Bacteroidota bacterium]
MDAPVLPPRVLVTGADGLLGQALTRRLSRWPGLDLLLTGRGGGPRLGAFAGGWVPLDVTDARAVERVMLDFAPTAVVHLAAMSKVEPCEQNREACWEVNVHATERLAQSCHRHGARLVFVSTDFVFDGTAGPYAEDDRPAPINAYGRSKLAAENAIRGSRLGDWTILRTALGFGDVAGYPEGRFNLATFLVRELSAGREVQVTTDQIRTPTFAPDLAEGIAHVLRLGTNGLYHVAGEDLISTFAFAERLTERFGYDPALLVPVTTAELHPGAPRPLQTGLLTLRAQTEMGFRATPLDDALDALGHHLGILPPSASAPRRGQSKD